MSLNVTAAALSESGKELSRNWEAARVHWRDTKADHFESEYLDAMPSVIGKSAEGMAGIERFLRQVRRECE